MGENKHRFLFEWDDGESFYKLERINEFENDGNIYELLEVFKAFLRGCGICDMTVSRIQYLEDDEWKHVLTQYGEWDSHKEEIYNTMKKLG